MQSDSRFDATIVITTKNRRDELRKALEVWETTFGAASATEDC